MNNVQFSDMIASINEDHYEVFPDLVEVQGMDGVYEFGINISVYREEDPISPVSFSMAFSKARVELVGITNFIVDGVKTPLTNYEEKIMFEKLSNIVFREFTDESDLEDFLFG